MLGTASDEKLVARALAGSNGAWTALVTRYDRRIYNYALRMVGHPDDALDLVQEVFLGVYRNLASYRSDGVFAAWLFRIASFRCTDYLRRRRNTESFEETTTDAAPTPYPAAAFDPVQEAMTTHANSRITQALATLPSAQRHVVELKFFQHFTFENIGEQLGISPNTAKTRLYSALKKLKAVEELQDEL